MTHLCRMFGFYVLVRLIKSVKLVFRTGCFSNYQVDCGKQYCLVSFSSVVKAGRVFAKS